MNIPESLKTTVEDNLSQKIVGAGSVSGGDVSSACILKFESGEPLFLKYNKNAPLGLFVAEAKGLEELATCEEVTVPKVHLVSESVDNTPAFILMEAFEPGSHGPEDEKIFAKQLAAMHKIDADACGFDDDNFIGRLDQINTPTKDWGEFFVEFRIKPQARLGSEAGWFTYVFEDLLANKVEKILELLAENDEPPCLLHGDLWGGNVFWSAKGPVLIDPAVYYGSREADIAFTTMFGGFGRDFYEAYNEEFPLKPGFEVRKDILNLYHQMTHSNLFGGSYIGSVKRTLEQI